MNRARLFLNGTVFSVALSCAMAMGQTAASTAAGSAATNHNTAKKRTAKDNEALTRLYDEDQSARASKSAIDWSKLGAEDERRRGAVHHMLDAGEVRTANDYWHAAMVYQHGQKPDDYLLAHVLAVDAISLGSKEARWLSAASLDRYLRATKQPQIFGTQFESLNEGPLTQQEMNSLLISDSMRAIVCVASRAEQQTMLDGMKHGGEFHSTSVDDCK